MTPSSRPEGHLNLKYLPTAQPRSGTSTGSSSPNEMQSAGSMKSPFGGSNGLANSTSSIGSSRMGAGSPSHELGGNRLYSKRAREIQAQEGLSPQIWSGPPTSGNSTPLRGNIPESPNQDEFPDLVPHVDLNFHNTGRRTRAGTVPSRFPPLGPLNGVTIQSSIVSQTSRPTPSTSPFRPHHTPGVETPRVSAAGNEPNPILLSRLRAGSMPQRTNILGSGSPFGPSVFSTNWSSVRDRATTLSSIKSSEGPTSPSQSSFSRDGLADADVKTLDYLGLAETPQQVRATLVRPGMEVLLQHQAQQQSQQQQQQSSALPPLLAELAMLNRGSNRFRSYSVNAKEKYAQEDEEFGDHYSALPSGSMTPSAAAAAAQLAATQAQIHQHNLAVQAFASHASSNRPRARTAGVLDAPPQRSSIRNYLATPSRLDNSFTGGDARINEGSEYEGLSEAVQLMHLSQMASGRTGQEPVDENNLEGPTRALWIGGIPVSTTVTSLDAIFSVYGKIESTRVLTHKSCGFVNFERVESAMQARSLLNGKEIFPGAGPVRIGYAKVPPSPSAETPGQVGGQESPTLDANQGYGGSTDRGDGISAPVLDDAATATPTIPELAELLPEMAQIVTEFGASEMECRNITLSIQRAINFKTFEDEIPPVPEPSQTRVFDAPRLRDIRKRIDNGACTVQEIEEIAGSMLPEIAELASDYLGNTVVQKLFEFCSEPSKEQMLLPIAPHLAEIGVHKNGTWAAQKIIDVAKLPSQKQVIVENLRPYTVPLFLDQYGNYVLQCCLRFGPPYNDFIFETMLSRMWEISHGRFGARAMRACLESHHASKDQQRMLASAIALHSVQLATNANGALLLTWFLDTCTFPHRRTVLAPRLVPHLVALCTHKVAYLTVLKIVNQRNEPEARDIILKALFFSPGDETLENILKDQASGATLIFKVLTTPFFEDTMRAEVVKTVAKVLTKLKTSPSQGYKRLMDEVGLSSRGTTSRDNQTREHSVDKNQRHAPRQPANNYPSHHVHQDRFNPPLGPSFQVSHPSLNSPASMTRSISSDQAIPPYDPYGLVNMNTLGGLQGFNLSNQGFGPDSLPLNQQQLHYQTLLAQNRGMSPGYFPPGIPNNGMNGFPTPGPGPGAPGSLDGFRNMQHNAQMGMGNGAPPQMHNPMLQQPGFGGIGVPQFSPVMGASQLYNYPHPQQYYSPQGAQGPPAPGRRGRR
ncbi:hypothetical protein FQN57_003403 [Myotisia sp. PD_48]|nr:hypothetical protein FQN57_003403 [Myotisia sp. PD_48]